MELLIPGLILVALMIYASTRIKRTAAAAFEAETVETNDFRIEKAEGFLNVVGGPHLFEAYSKEFGKENDNLRLATLTLSNRDAGAEVTPEGNVLTDISEVIGERHYRLIESEQKLDGVNYRIFNKRAEKDGTLYDLEARVLGEAGAEPLNKVDAMLASFELK